MTVEDLEPQIRSLTDQVHQLDATIPLATYAPATVATQKAMRDELTRQANVLLEVRRPRQHLTRPRGRTG